MGFIILVIFFIYTLISIVLAVGANNLGRRKGWKWCNWWVVLTFMILILVWDIPISKLYFKKLCADEAGYIVYRKVELPDRYFYDKGDRNESYTKNSPYAYAKGGEVRFDKVTKKFSIDSEFDHKSYMGGRIKKKTTLVSNISTGELLSRADSFFYIGGWVTKAISDPFIVYEGTEECPITESGSSRNIHDKVVEETFILSD